MMAGVQFRPKSPVMHIYLYSTILLKTLLIFITPSVSSFEDSSEFQLRAVAKTHSILNVSWTAESLQFKVRHWLVLVSDNHTGETCVTVESGRRFHAVNHLKPDVAYSIGLHVLTADGRCIGWRGLRLTVTLPGDAREPDLPSVSQSYSVDKETVRLLPEHACRIGNNCGGVERHVRRRSSGSSSLDGDIKAQTVETGADQKATPSPSETFAEGPRQRLVWWVLVVGGAGLVVIIILSAITVLLHRPWRSREKVEMRKLSQLSKNDPLGNNSHCVTSGECPAGVIVGEIQILEVSPIHSKVTDAENRRNVQSAISWGSEFDGIDAPSDDLYINVNIAADSPQAVGPAQIDVASYPAKSSMWKKWMPGNPFLQLQGWRPTSGLYNKKKRPDADSDVIYANNAQIHEIVYTNVCVSKI
ncbi:unnamed protein product [Lymnaea stagnalis]|uniref:Fibronectin type-III domain-containing protein n=1 Tax=Lymnaea stagnalis TaxID=6523 RepID=A0AAV2IDK2_LYMST